MTSWVLHRPSARSVRSVTSPHQEWGQATGLLSSAIQRPHHACPGCSRHGAGVRGRRGSAHLHHAGKPPYVTAPGRAEPTSRGLERSPVHWPCAAPPPARSSTSRSGPARRAGGPGGRARPCWRWRRHRRPTRHRCPQRRVRHDCPRDRPRPWPPSGPDLAMGVFEGGVGGAVGTFTFAVGLHGGVVCLRPGALGLRRGTLQGARQLVLPRHGYYTSGVTVV